MLLHSTPAAAMMPGTMSEQTAPSARAPHEPTVHLTFAEAAERLHITPNAVRMRVHRGTLASVRINERTFVVWPQPAQPHEQRTHGARDERSEDRDALIETLRSENAYLRQQLDHQTHIVAGLVQRLPELPAGEPSQDAPVTHERAPTPHERREAFWHTPAGPPSALRGWIRRLIGH